MWEVERREFLLKLEEAAAAFGELARSKEELERRHACTVAELVEMGRERERGGRGGGQSALMREFEELGIDPMMMLRMGDPGCTTGADAEEEEGWGRGGAGGAWWCGCGEGGGAGYRLVRSACVCRVPRQE